MKKLLLILFLALLSCEESENYGEIYYFDQVSLNTMDPFICSEVENNDGILKINLFDEEIYNLLKNSLENNSGNRIPDVRYKLKFSNDTICLDYAGNYITTSGKYGKFEFMKRLKEYIEENRDDGVNVTQPW